MSTEIPGGADWHDDFRAWLEPFLAAFQRSEQRYWAPLYLQGLLGPGHRKSVEPMAERVCPGQTQQLHHFVSTSTWATEPLEQVLRQTADALVGGDDAALIVDDVALPKQGRHSVGVKRQHCGVLGKQANCQVLVSLTLRCPDKSGQRLFMPPAPFGCGSAAVRRPPAPRCPASYDGADGCTSPQRHTHSTESQEVRYRWHPWFGQRVWIHNTRLGPGGGVVRGGLTPDLDGRAIEIPLWMFDPVACARMELAAEPFVCVDALRELALLLQEAGRPRAAGTPVLQAEHLDLSPAGGAHAVCPQATEPGIAAACRASIWMRAALTQQFCYRS